MILGFNIINIPQLSVIPTLADDVLVTYAYGAFIENTNDWFVPVIERNPYVTVREFVAAIDDINGLVFVI